MHKFTYQHLGFFADLLRLAVPARATELDFAGSEQLPTSASPPVAIPASKQRHGDMVWRVPHQGEAPDGGHPHLVAVVESMLQASL